MSSSPEHTYPLLDLGPGDVESCAKFLASYLPEEIIESGRLSQSAAKILSALENLASPEVIKSRAAHFGVREALMREKLFFRDGARFIVSGLRFRSLNPNFPFVHFSANFSPTKSELLGFRERALAEYAPVPLRGITIRQGPAYAPGISSEFWSHTLFGKIADVPELALPGSLEARWEKGTSFFPAYQNEYEKFFAENPEKKEFLRSEEAEDMEAAAEARLLMSVYDAEGWAGAIAGRAKELYGKPCVYLFELFLAGRLRGKGLAAPFEAHFLRELAPRYSGVYGHISNSNPASLRTALAMRRSIVESELFFPY